MLWGCLQKRNANCHDDTQAAYEVAHRARQWGLEAAVWVSLDTDLHLSLETQHLSRCLDAQGLDAISLEALSHYHPAMLLPDYWPTESKTILFCLSFFSFFCSEACFLIVSFKTWIYPFLCLLPLRFLSFSLIWNFTMLYRVQFSLYLSCLSSQWFLNYRFYNSLMIWKIAVMSFHILLLIYCFFAFLDSTYIYGSSCCDVFFPSFLFTVLLSL